MLRASRPRLGDKSRFARLCTASVFLATSYTYKTNRRALSVLGSLFLWAREDSPPTGAVRVSYSLCYRSFIYSTTFESSTEGMQIPSFALKQKLHIHRMQFFTLVGERGLEPPILAEPAPKAGVSTNFTTRPKF